MSEVLSRRDAEIEVISFRVGDEVRGVYEDGTRFIARVTWAPWYAPAAIWLAKRLRPNWLSLWILNKALQNVQAEPEWQADSD